MAKEGGGPAAPLAAAVIVAMVAVILAGFWPWYAHAPRALLDLLGGGTARGDDLAPRSGTHPVVHLHGVVATGWLLLLAAQVALVHRRKVAVHRRLGRAGAAYGVALLLSGVAVTFVAPAQAVLSVRDTVDEAAAFLLLPLGDLLLFAGFFGAALLHRRRREIHGRLMILAAVALIYPGAARFAGDWGLLPVILVWLLPLGIAMARDLREEGRISPAYAWGAAVLLLALSRLWVMDTEPWLRIGRPLIRLLLGER